MKREDQADRTPRGMSTLDLMLFTAGFACGWVMHQASALRIELYYDLPFVTGKFQSLLGTAWIGWLWASVSGLAFLIVARPFRGGRCNRPADWLAVALAIVLFESFYQHSTGMRTYYYGEIAQGYDRRSPRSRSEFEVQCLLDDHLFPTNRASDYPVTFEVRWIGHEPWENRWLIAVAPITAAVVVCGVAAWCLRAGSRRAGCRCLWQRSLSWWHSDRFAWPS